MHRKKFVTVVELLITVVDVFVSEDHEIKTFGRTVPAFQSYVYFIIIFD
jgi:hypothetical protein